MKKMGLDIGRVRIGIALSDQLSMLASAKETYVCKSRKDDLQHIVELANANDVSEIVVGLPLNMDGTRGKTADYVKQFCDELRKRTSAKIVFEDERLTSVEAEEILLQQNLSREKRKAKIDQVAAVLILQAYLDRK